MVQKIVFNVKCQNYNRDQDCWKFNQALNAIESTCQISEEEYKNKMQTLC